MLNMEVKDLNRLKLVLVQKKRTAVWLAGELGVSPVTVSKWCSQKTQPDLKTLSRIAELLEVDKRELLTLAQALQKPFHDVMAKPYHVLCHYNGWSNDVTVDVPMIQLTTLDENKDAKKVVNNNLNKETQP